MIFAGIDLGWISQPSGVARLDSISGELRLGSVERRASHREVLDWIADQAGAGPAMLAIDAPLVITNATGTRPCERDVNADFRRYHAGCHASNQARPFYAPLMRFASALAERGFRHAAEFTPGEPGRWMIEVHPHAAAVAVFGLDRILKYKKGRVADRRRELTRFRELLRTLVTGELPEIPPAGRALKPVEDMLDAIFAAWIAADWWRYGQTRGRCYGTVDSGYIVVPLARARPASR